MKNITLSTTSSPGSPFSLFFFKMAGARREDPGVGCSIKRFDWLLRKILRIALIGYYDIKMVDYYILFCIGNITRVIFIFLISDKGLNSEVLIALTCKLVTSKDHSKVTVMKCKVTSSAYPAKGRKIALNLPRYALSHISKIQAQLIQLFENDYKEISL